jgi:hypothetical protein
MSHIRAQDGRFTSAPPASPPCTLGHARLTFDTSLAAVCAHQGLRPREVERQLSHSTRSAEVRRGLGRGRLLVNPEWKAAVYARQLAMYLANTSDNIPQVLLAQVTGLTPAAVCLALREIEDLRDHGHYDQAVELIAAEMAVAR